MSEAVRGMAVWRRTAIFYVIGNCKAKFNDKYNSSSINYSEGECEAFSKSSPPGDDFLYLEYSIKSFHLKINVR